MNESSSLLRAAPSDRTRLARLALIDTAISLLETKPADELNVAEISRLAGVSRPTFYRHFENPQVLVRAAVITKLQTALAAHMSPAAEEDWIPGARTTVQQLLQELHGDAPLYLNSLEGQLGLQLMADVIEFLNERILEHSPLGPSLRSTEGTLSAGDRASFLSAGIAWHIVQWLYSDFTGRNSIENMTERIVAYLVDAAESVDAQ